MTKQIESVDFAGAITTSGNAVVTVTANGMTGSSVSVLFSVSTSDDLSEVAQSARYACATDQYVSEFFLAGGSNQTLQLTARNDADNDATMNIAIDNGTCAGLTPVATSTNVQAGAAVVSNGYCTVAEFKAWARIESLGITDDATIIQIIEGSSREIDRIANTTFYAATADRLFDCPRAETMLFYRHCTAINTITNGDGSTVSAGDYVTLKGSTGFIYGVTLIQNQWRASSLTDLQCVTVNADWGDSTTTPDDIRKACLMICKQAYNRRFGENMTSQTTVTNGGVFITPEDIPAEAREIILNHKVFTV